MKARTFRARWAEIRLGPSAMIGMVVLVTIVASCVLTLPWTLGASEHGDSSRYEAQQLDLILLPPSWTPYRADEVERYNTAAENAQPFLVFGTDRLGRDLFIRCLAGGGISLSIGISAALIAVVIGTIYGTLAGYVGGRVDAVLMRVVDVLYGLPYILLVVLFAVAVEGLLSRVESSFHGTGGDDGMGVAAFLVRHQGLVNVLTLLLAIGSVSWLTMARVIRGQVLSLKRQPFIEASRAIGVPFHTQVRRHMLPNLLGPIVVYATLTVPLAILQESFLSFLGIGVQPPLPSWGNLASEGLSELNPIRSRWWLLFWPCMLLAVTLLSLNFVGEGLRSCFDPRSRSPKQKK